MDTDPFLAQLAALCRSDRTRAKWVLVPAHSIGHTLGERLALESGSWANVRFRTPFDLAIEMAAPFLVERGIDPLGDDLGPPLMMRLLRELPASVPGYFRQLAVHPTMGTALWSSVVELRLAGVTARDLPPGAFEKPAKHAELQALLSAYESWLVTEHRADTASICLEALDHPAACPVRASDLVLELPDTLWSPLVRRFLDALPGTNVAPHVPRIPGLALPRRLAAAARVEKDVASPLAFVMDPAARAGRTPVTALTLFAAGGPEAEVEEVFRRILHAPGGPLRLDAVEIACASSEYPLLVWQKARRYGWPVTLASGLPATVAAPARALLAWCDWIAGGFLASGLRGMLESGDIRVDIPDGPGSGQAASLLLRAKPTWGRRTYEVALDALALSERERADDPEIDEDSRQRRLCRAASAERLRDWIGTLLAPLPDPDVADVAVQALVSAANAFVSRVAAIASELDGQAARAVKDALAELRSLGDIACPAAAALTLIRATLDGVRVASDRARPGHLHVTTLPRAGYVGRPRTFIVGLQEGEVFPSRFEDAVLLDAERGPIHVALATSSDRIGEAVHSVVSRMAVLPSAGTRSGPAVCLSYSCRDLRDARQTFPSWLMLQAFRLTQPGVDVTYKHLDASLGEPRSQVPQDPAAALGDAGWWLANLRVGAKKGVERVLAAFPDLARGAFAEAERDSDRFTAYDGLVRSAGAVLDPRRTGRPISPTRLEKLAGCPFRYLMEHGLGLEPIDEGEQDQDAWLDAPTRGTVLHDLYAAMMRELRRRNEKADPARHLGWLTSRADEALADLRESAPPASEEVFNRERDAIRRDLELFLAIEQDASRDGVTPIAFEVAFAGRGDPGAEPLGRPDPVAVTLPGLRFLLGGRIDRIDRLPDGRYEVVDYKTGRCYRSDYRKTFRNGRLLQHALYTLAAEELLRSGGDPGATVVGGRYDFPSVKGGGQSLRIARPGPSTLASVLGEILGLISGGAFMASAHAKNKEDCKFCDFSPLCGGEVAVTRAAVKLANDRNTALECYRRLQGEDHE